LRLRHSRRLRGLARWALWSKGRAVVSHETALEVHGMGEPESRLVHVTVPPGFTMRDKSLSSILPSSPGATSYRGPASK
jgi:hypothetical protein